MQDHALCRKLLLDRTRHVSSPFDLTSTRHCPAGPLSFAHRAFTCKRRQIGGAMPKNTASADNLYFFVK
jgi:hypothetical protein